MLVRGLAVLLQIILYIQPMTIIVTNAIMSGKVSIMMDSLVSKANTTPASLLSSTIIKTFYAPTD